MPGAAPKTMDITELIALTRREYVRAAFPFFDELHESDPGDSPYEIHIMEGEK